MDVLLVLPNVYFGTRIGDHESKEPLGLLYLVAVLRASGLTASVLQADFHGLSIEQTATVIMMHRPSVVGFQMTQRSASSTLRIVRRLRETGFVGHITAGGYFPTLSFRELLASTDDLDSVVIGEGEQTFSELVRCILSGSDWRRITHIRQTFSARRGEVATLLGWSGRNIGSWGCFRGSRG